MVARTAIRTVMVFVGLSMGCGWNLDPPLMLDAGPSADAGRDVSVVDVPDAACVPGRLRSCYDGPSGTDGVGACHGGMSTCSAHGSWGPCTGEVEPSPEVCGSGVDTDCNGTMGTTSRACFDATPTYARSVSPLAWQEVCALPGVVIVLAGDDDDLAPVILPFNFPFYGTSQTDVNISSNGFVSFGAGSTVYQNPPLPNPDVPDTIFAFYDDLVLRAGICVATAGTAPARTFVAEWSDAFFYPNDTTTSNITFEVVLSESGGLIDVLYHQMVGEGDRATGLSATIGLQAGAGGLYDQVAYDTAGVAVTGTGYRWTPSQSRAIGACTQGTQSCTGGTWGMCMGGVTATPEICDNVDNDCNGLIDDGIYIPCYTGPAATRDVGSCHPGAQICHAGVLGPCVGEVLPTTGACMNGLDDNCDGTPDTGC